MRDKILLFFCLLIFLTMLSAGLVLKKLSKPLELAEPVRVEVLYGESIYRVAEKLEQQGILENPGLWIWYGRIFDMARFIKAGEYQVVPGDSVLHILEKMVKGDVIQYSVTLLEGWTTAQAIKAIQSAEGVASTLDFRDHKQILKSIGAADSFSHSEGLFYPDTYAYVKGTKDREVLQRAHDKLIKALNKAWESREENLPYQNRYEVLIMASIIERETAVDSERNQIAGVFVERLEKGMRLQTDPTVIYGMGDNYQGKIGYRDLRTPTPYNTYTMKGLPPTPIALPTEASLMAAVKPLRNGKLYFVAKGDGYHYFSDTLEEHEKAVREYQLSRKSGYRSSPAQGKD